jgi:hypothetical protein
MEEIKTIEEIKEMAIEDWSKLSNKPTLEIDCRFGKIFFVCDKEERDKMVSEGNICFSPLELRELVMARKIGAVPDDMVEALILAKQELPGARLHCVLRAGERVVKVETVEVLEKKPLKKTKEFLSNPDRKKLEQMGLL